MKKSSHGTRTAAAKVLARGGLISLRSRQGSETHRPLPWTARASLVRRGEAVRVGHGVYQSTAKRDVVGIHPYKAIAGALAGQPYFISWWSALAYHDLTEQRPLTIHVGVQSQHRPQVLAGYEVRFVRLKPDKFRSGINTVSIDGVQVRIATPERAILDSLDRQDLGGGLTEVVKALVDPTVNHECLVQLALRYPSTAVIRRLGYLMSVLDAGDPTKLLARRGRSGYTPLDAELRSTGMVDTRWQVVDSVGADVLSRWASRDT